MVFCHVLETADTTDLARLEHFISSIESHCTGLHAAEKLQRTFRTLFKTAHRFVELQHASTGDATNSNPDNARGDMHVSNGDQYSKAVQSNYPATGLVPATFDTGNHINLTSTAGSRTVRIHLASYRKTTCPHSALNFCKAGKERG